MPVLSVITLVSVPLKLSSARLGDGGMQVLREMLAGVDGEVVASLLKSALDAYAADVAIRDEGDGGRGRRSAGEEGEKNRERNKGDWKQEQKKNDRKYAGEIGRAHV